MMITEYEMDSGIDGPIKRRTGDEVAGQVGSYTLPYRAKEAPYYL